MSPKLKIPLLLILAIVIILIMLRLAVWQLDRAEQKQGILDQVSQRAEQANRPLTELLSTSNINDLKYRSVTATGVYEHENSIYVDNQVVAGQVGYRIFTPFRFDDTFGHVMVNRGWLPVGESREVLPTFQTNQIKHTLYGRLNSAPPQPPLWNDDYPVAQGSVWAYLPLDEYASQMKLTLLPLVLELAPTQVIGSGESILGNNDSQFVITWSDINDEWVAKHQGYAFQWLMMAIAFFVACLILLIRYSIKKND